MRSVRVLVLIVFMLLALTSLPLSYAQPITQTAVYLPFVFKGLDLPLLNGDFEAQNTGWTFLNGAFAASGGTSHGGRRHAFIGGDDADDEAISQRVRVSADTPYLLYWYNASSAEIDCTQDVAYVRVNNQVVDTIQEFCEAGEHSTWRRRTIDLSAYADQVIQLTFVMDTDQGVASHWSVDDVAFVATP